MNPMDDDSSLDKLEIGPRGGDVDPPSPRRKDPPIWIWVVLGILALAAIVYFFWWRPRTPGVVVPVDPTVAEAPDASGEAGAAEPDPGSIVLPPLAASDPVVRELLEALTDHPALARLLVPDRLVQRFVASVDNIAEGVSPRPHLGFLQPRAGFHTEVEDGRLVATPETYDRYDRWARLFASLDPAQTAELYLKLEPLLQEAYGELGYPGDRFRVTLLRAMDRLIATPIVPEDAGLVAKVDSYAFEDPDLEELGAAEKHLVRMGPDNARTVRDHLARIRDRIAAGPPPTLGRQGANEEPDSEG